MVLVAKSFQGLEQIGDPYVVAGKKYIDVKLKNGNTRKVRVYTQAEYDKYYKSSAAAPNKENDPYWKSQKMVLGFVNDYITIFKGNTYDCKEWFKEHGATYTRLWGWSIASNLEVPEELPEGITPIRLDWNLVGTDKEVLKPDSMVQAAIDSLIYEDDGSEFVGEVGDKLELYLTVDKNIQYESVYGISHTHVMHDDDGNTFVWTTTSKNWEVGTERHIKGTVKEHKVYKNNKSTILTRCREVAD